jgi:AcrR family transcriptional regulator
MPALKQETAVQRRAHLLDAGMRCFARNGYKGTTMRDIAREAGVTTGAIYAHFKGKEELLTSLAQRFTAERSEAFESSAPEVPAPRALEETLMSLTDYLDTERAEDSLRTDIVMLSEALNDPVLNGHLVATDLQHISAYEKILKRNKKWRRGVTAKTLAEVVTGAVYGLLILRAYHTAIDRKKYIRCLGALVEAASTPPCS